MKWGKEYMGEREKPLLFPQIMHMLFTFIFMGGTGEGESRTTGMRIAGHK
jgi:hypothetical protein